MLKKIEIEGWKVCCDDIKGRKHTLVYNNIEDSKIFLAFDLLANSISINFLKEKSDIYANSNAFDKKYDFQYFPASLLLSNSGSEDKNVYTVRGIYRYNGKNTRCDFDFSSVTFFTEYKFFGMFASESPCRGLKNEEIQFKRSIMLADVYDNFDNINNNIFNMLKKIQKVVNLDENQIDSVYECCKMKDFNYDFEKKIWVM